MRKTIARLESVLVELYQISMMMPLIQPTKLKSFSVIRGQRYQFQHNRSFSIGFRFLQSFHSPVSVWDGFPNNICI